MIRLRRATPFAAAASLIAAFLILLAAIAVPQAAAQSPAPPSPAAQPCDGRFERMLRGLFLYAAELLPFLESEATVAACRRQLDPANDDHALIDAWLLRHGPAPDEAQAQRRFAAACGRGHVLACSYGAWPRGLPPDADAAAAAAERLLPLLDAQLPAIDTMAGLALLSRDNATASDIETATQLLRRASDRGDWWATTTLLEEMRERPPPEIEADSPRHRALLVDLEERAAAQGNVAQMMVVAHALRHEMNDPHGALRLYRRAADADPRWFQSDIARANYELAKMLRAGEGAPPDPIAAARHLVRAAELGHEEARKELEQR